ncbi:hypothetical protein [Craterilacuibacter sinensis]|uniref:Uncharacterized protein n=1 Tax=Craterilacuibacter sinensis TaxID=2686017 RepID=A0A845BT67_9NEIS|nr:hypothetical protein [Craterilacuibacter sinensis]MXR37771.1 hypothetical protein [Craterilacuibacter sinensis]RQW27302.1 hypothetical protein EHS17_08475 [Rhodobacteraceae bacterium CH30]
MTAKRKKLLLLALALLALGAIKFALIRHYLQQEKTAQAEVLQCDVLAGCALPSGGMVKFRQPPLAGQPFVIDISGVGKAEPKAEFSMVSMDMGFNRYSFVSEGQNWSANVHLPVCVSGSKDWQMTLLLDGRRYTLPFAVR